MKLPNFLSGKTPRLFKVKGPYDLATPLGGTRIFVDGVYVVQGSRAWVRMGLSTIDPSVTDRLEVVSQDEISKFAAK